MKVRVVSRFSIQTEYLEDWIEHEMKYSYSEDSAGQAQDGVKQLSAAFGRLLSVLTEKNLLNLEEVADIVGSYATLTKVDEEG